MSWTERSINKLKKTVGIQTDQEKFAYGVDEQFGFMSQAKIPDKWIKTTCGYCSVGCGMFIGVRNGKAVSVKGDVDHRVNYGKLCPKGLSEHEFLNSANRATHPLIKENGKFKQASWDEALSKMVEQVGSVQKKYGKSSFGVVSTGQLVTEEFYTLGKLVQLGFGSNNYDGNTTLCMSSAVAGYKRSFGSDGPPGAYEDFAASDCILLIGANIADNHPILSCWLEANVHEKKNLIVVDPRLTKTAMMASLYLPAKPRSDIDLLNGIMHLLIENNWIDANYIEKHTTGFDALKEHLKTYTPDFVSKKTGLAPDLIERTAQIIGKAQAPFVAWTMGVNHSDQGTETVNAINNLALITGNVGKVGASPFSITGQCNAMGTRETSFTSSLPGYRKFESEKDRKELAQLWHINEEQIPTTRGMAYPDIIEGIVKGKIKALWVIATNPLVSFPNNNYLLDALSRLECLIVQDGFHPIPTTEVADIALPAAIWGEKEGTYTNSERRVSKVNKAVDPPGEAKSDFDIFLALADKLKIKDKLYPNWTSPGDAFEEWKTISKGRLCDYSGLSYDLIEQAGGIQWPFPEGKKNVKTTRLYTNGIFETEDGKAKLWCVTPKEMPEKTSKEFPFLLNTGRTVEHWHTLTKTGEIPILDKISPEAWVEINPLDASKLALEQSDLIRVISRRGFIENIQVRITEMIAPGQIFIPFHWFKTNANNLTLSTYDPISREPNYKQCAIQIERMM